jgi:ATP-dependent DNA helicase RecG
MFRTALCDARKYDGVHDSYLSNLSETAIRILKLVEAHPVDRDVILSEFGYSTRTRNIRNAINKLLELKLIIYTIPDKARSKKQQYRITEQGKEVLKK